MADVVWEKKIQGRWRKVLEHFEAQSIGGWPFLLSKSPKNVDHRNNDCIVFQMNFYHE